MYKNDTLNGKYKRYFENGYLQYSLIYNMDKLWAIEEYNSEDSSMFNVGNLLEGTGSVSVYTPDGKPQSSGNFKNGYKEGYWMIYTREGKVIDSLFYINGRLNGKGFLNNVL